MTGKPSVKSSCRRDHGQCSQVRLGLGCVRPAAAAEGGVLGFRGLRARRGRDFRVCGEVLGRRFYAAAAGTARVARKTHVLLARRRALVGWFDARAPCASRLCPKTYEEGPGPRAPARRGNTKPCVPRPAREGWPSRWRCARIKTSGLGCYAPIPCFS